VGLKVVETRVEGRKAEPVAGSEYQLRAPMVISSIGSVPEKIPGVAMRGEYYDFNHETLPQYGESDHVFGVGNVVTGQGNIRSSLLHSQEVATKLIENYIGIADEGAAPARFYAGAEARGTAQALAVRDRVQVMRSLSYHEVAAIEQRILTIIPTVLSHVGQPYLTDYGRVARRSGGISAIVSARLPRCRLALRLPIANPRPNYPITALPGPNGNWTLFARALSAEG